MPAAKTKAQDVIRDVEPNRKLTEMELKVFNFVMESTIRNLYQPSLNEIGNECGFKKYFEVDKHLHALERAGLIIFTGQVNRAIKFCRRTPLTSKHIG